MIRLFHRKANKPAVPQTEPPASEAAPPELPEAKQRSEMPPPGARLLTVPQAAYYLGKTPYGMRCLLWDGSIPYIQGGAKKQKGNTCKIWIDKNKLDEWVERESEYYE